MWYAGVMVYMITVGRKLGSSKHLFGYSEHTAGISGCGKSLFQSGFSLERNREGRVKQFGSFGELRGLRLCDRCLKKRDGALSRGIGLDLFAFLLYHKIPMTKWKSSLEDYPIEWLEEMFIR